MVFLLHSLICTCFLPLPLSFSQYLQTPGPGALSIHGRQTVPPHGGLPPATSQGSYQQDQDHGALVDVVSVYSRTFAKPAPEGPRRKGEGKGQQSPFSGTVLEPRPGSLPVTRKGHPDFPESQASANLSAKWVVPSAVGCEAGASSVEGGRAHEHGPVS